MKGGEPEIICIFFVSYLFSLMQLIPSAWCAAVAPGTMTSAGVTFLDFPFLCSTFSFLSLAVFCRGRLPQCCAGGVSRAPPPPTEERQGGGRAESGGGGSQETHGEEAHTKPCFIPLPRSWQRDKITDCKNADEKSGSGQTRKLQIDLSCSLTREKKHVCNNIKGRRNIFTRNEKGFAPPPLFDRLKWSTQGVLHYTQFKSSSKWENDG